MRDIVERPDPARGGAILIRPGKADALSRRTGDTVLVRNDSGVARAAFDVMALGDTVNDPTAGTAVFRDRVVVEGTVPATPHQRWGVLQKAAAVDATVPAVVAGLTLCRVDVSPLNRYSQIQGNADRADIFEAADYLRVCEAGRAELIWVDWPANPNANTADVRWCIVRIASRHTDGVTIYEQGNDANRGVAEVWHVTEATVTEAYPGCVIITPT